MGCSLGPAGKMEADQVILTEQVSILHPSQLVSTILRETETDRDREAEKDKGRDGESQREGETERDSSV